MKRKIIAFTLFFTMIILIAGCSNKESEKVTIEFWHNYSASDGQIEVLENLIDEFEADNTNIKVNQVYMEWGSLKSSVVLGSSTGILPDVLRGDIAFVPQFQSLNVLEPMSNFDDYDLQTEKVLAAPNSSNKMGDDFYGIAANTNTKILFYNKTLLNDANVDVPESLDELWDAASELSNPPVVGMVEPWTGIWNIGPYIWSEGGDVLSPDNTTADGYINSQIVIDVTQKLADLYAANALGGPSMDPGAIGDTDGWAAGTYALQLDGPWRENANIAAGVDYGAIPLPPGSNGSISVLGGENFMQFKTSDEAHKNASWEFVKFMTSKHAQVEMAKVGQMPVNIEALSDSEVLEIMPLLPVFKEALLTAKARPVISQWSEVEDIIASKVAEAITGQKSVKVALDQAAAEIDELLSN